MEYQVAAFAHAEEIVQVRQLPQQQADLSGFYALQGESPTYRRINQSFPKRSRAMRNGTYEIRVHWDSEARVWVAESDDVPGLVTEAESCEALVEKLKVLIPELLEANGIRPPGREVPFHLLSERTEKTCIAM